MGKNLYDRYPAARRVFVRAEQILEMPVRRLCFDGPVEELNRTDVIQPCVMTVCWAAYEVWRESYGLENVSVTAGHSLGEIASLAAAGSIPWETDRKSTRLNSSHVEISYAVFCLKKK